MNTPPVDASTAPRSAPPPAVSIIITWKDRPVIGEMIRRNWPFLRNERYEVVIVNSGGNRQALDELLRGTSDGRLQIVEAWRERFNKCYALNVGVAASTGNSLFFLDADVVMAEDVVGMTSSLLDGRSFVTMKWLVESDPRTRSNVIGDISLTALLEITIPDGRKTLVETNLTRPSAGVRFGGGMIAMERRHFLAVGGMNSALEGWGFEDTDLIVRLQFALDLRRIQAGELTHLTHGDEERCLFGLSRAQSENANWLKSMVNYSTGNFTGTYATDVAAALKEARRSASPTGL